MVAKADDSIGAEIAAQLIVGSQRIFLSNYDKLSEKITIDNSTYLVELISASDTDTTIMVSKCKSGEILELSKTSNKSNEINKTESTNTTLNQNITAKNSEFNLTGNDTRKNETKDNSTEQQEKIGLFRKILNWISGFLKL